MQFPRGLLPPGSRPFDVVGLGENSFDLLTVLARYPPPDTKQSIRRFLSAPGGQVATALVACARLGWRARYIGRVGDDEYGRMGVAALRQARVDTSAVQTVAGASSRLAVILVDEETGARTVLWQRDDRLRLNAGDVPLDAVTSGRILHVDCTDVGAATAAACAARESGLRTTIDVEAVVPGLEGLLPCIDVIIAAEAFPRAFTGYTTTGRALAALADAYPQAIVCATLGEQGSLARWGGREIRTPGFRVACVDSTGAGDVYRAGFIAHWLAAGDAAVLEDALLYANAAAALSCCALGARGALPTAAEVEALVRSR